MVSENENDVLANLDELVAEAAELDRQVLNRSPLEAFLEFAALQSDTDKLKNGEAVTLMTLHAAKDWSFPVVVLVAVEENILPHRAARTIRWRLRKNDVCCSSASRGLAISCSSVTLVVVHSAIPSRRAYQVRS